MNVRLLLEAILECIPFCKRANKWNSRLLDVKGIYYQSHEMHLEKRRHIKSLRH